MAHSRNGLSIEDMSPLRADVVWDGLHAHVTLRLDEKSSISALSDNSARALNEVVDLAARRGFAGWPFVAYSHGQPILRGRIRFRPKPQRPRKTRRLIR